MAHLAHEQIALGKLGHNRAEGFLAVLSASHQLVKPFFHMRRDFLRDVGFARRLKLQMRQAPGIQACSASVIRLIAATKFCQVLRWARRTFLPLRVSR